MTEKHSILGGKVKIYRRDRSGKWQCSTYLNGKNWRESTKEDSLSRAKDFAEDWYFGLVAKSRTGELKVGKTFKLASEHFLREYEVITNGERHPQALPGHAGRLALGRLDGLSLLLPDASLFLYMYVRKEAVLSSQIEGTQSSLSDLLLFESEEAPGVPLDDVTEVSCYVAAMNHGLERLKDFPLSLRLLREIHGILMNNARGGHKQPGEFRTTQNWIGGSRPSSAMFVPPPPEKLMECLGDFEKFLHDETVRLPALIKAALAHVQFETIHPFLDGNGRLGRLLITFILCTENVLKEPLLYLSLYLKTHRQQYYQHLQSVRETGDWEAWIQFFLRGVVETSNQAAEAARAIVALLQTDRARIEQHAKSKASALTIHAYLQKHPVTKPAKIVEACGLSLPTVLRALNVLEELTIVREITGKERNKIFSYRAYLDILSTGTEPLK